MRYLLQYSFLLLCTFFIIFSCKEATEPESEPNVSDLLSNGIWVFVSTNVINNKSDFCFEFNSDGTGETLNLECEAYVTWQWTLEDNDEKIRFFVLTTDETHYWIIESIKESELILIPIIGADEGPKMYFRNFPKSLFCL